jgi:D-alanyl-D-alanine carboxypeptidase/D-alanyl-D-alanine-endopeptidase (penicillin-binding protein 4)
VGALQKFSGTAALLALLLVGGPAWAEDDSTHRHSSAKSELLTIQSAASKENAAIKELKAQLTAIWSGANLRRGTTAIHVVDAETGEALYSVHEEEALNPASNVKLISTGTVLATLGPNWRYQTQVLGAEPDAAGEVESGLYLSGNFDPTLGPGALSELAKSLFTHGVRTVTGDIVLSGEASRDVMATGRARVTVVGGAPGKAPSVNVWPASDLVAVHSKKVRTKRRGRSRVRLTRRIEDRDGQPSIMHIDLRGNIRTGHKRVLSAKIPDRTAFTADVFKKALQEAGIEVKGESRVGSLVDFTAEATRADKAPGPLAVHKSATIASLVTRVNKRSLNSLADRLVMTAARQVYGGPLRMSNAVELMKTWLGRIGVDADAVVLDTGSGLSYRTRLTTRQIVRVLRHAGGYSEDNSDEPTTKTFRDSLAISGIDGTLRRRFRNKDVSLHRSMHGKTGTLTSVIALSGFLAREDGRTICFSIVTNGHNKHKKQTVRLEHEHLVAQIDTFLDQSEASEQQPMTVLASADVVDAVDAPALPMTLAAPPSQAPLDVEAEVAESECAEAAAAPQVDDVPQAPKPALAAALPALITARLPPAL